MILNPLLEKIQTAVLGMLFLGAGLYTFGNAFEFDRLYIGILVFAAWLCRKEWNLLSIIIIVALERVVEEIAWINLTNEYAIKLPLYFLCSYLIYKCCYDALKWYCLGCLALVFSSEIYWLMTDYSPPEIYWHVYYLTQALVVRWLFIHRCFWICNILPDRHLVKVKSLDLDYILANLMTAYVVLSTFQLLEYMSRHVLALESIDYIYTLYPYIAHSMSTFILFSIFSTTLKFKQLNSLNA